MSRVVSCWVVWATLAAPSSFACETGPLELRKVTSDVTLLVTHHGKPIAGIEVKIFRMKDAIPLFTGITNEQGTVLHKRLAAGQYHVYASHEGFDAPVEWLEVVSRPDPKVVRRLDIQWVDWSYETSSVEGTLTGRIPGNTGNKIMDLVHPISTVYSGVALDLKRAFSGEDYKVISDSSGVFLFPEVPEGIYVLTIPGGMTSVTGTANTTKMVLDVEETSNRSTLPLELRDTGCYSIEFELAEK